jgi:hypothetical protein
LGGFALLQQARNTAYVIVVPVRRNDHVDLAFQRDTHTAQIALSNRP